MSSRRFGFLFLSSCFLLAIFGCFMSSSSVKPVKGYNFAEPDALMSLPDTLREISGITMIDDNTVGCIQDENGILFLYDLETDEIARQIPFAPNGDYEGLACVEDDMYILRSDGLLYYLRNYAGKNSRLDSFQTHIPAANNEGLCYDKKNNRLLIASKVASSRETKTRRMVHGFDLKTKTLLPDPVFTFDVHDIKQFARQHNIQLPEKVRKKDLQPEPFVRFKPSAVCLHPKTGSLFMLSAADHMLFVFDENGRMEQMEVLDKELFNKAEGICFLNDATLLISNEGQENKPTILRFNSAE